MDNPTREQMRAELARAMGWTQGAASGVWFSPPNAPKLCVYGVPPNPFDSADDSRALVTWLVESAPMRQRVLFLNLLLQQVNKRTDEQTIAAMMGGDKDADAGVRRDFSLLTAPLPVIAEAAWRAIQPAK